MLAAQIPELIEGASRAGELAKEDQSAFFSWAIVGILVLVLVGVGFAAKATFSAAHEFTKGWIRSLETIETRSQEHSDQREERMIQVIERNEQVVDRAMTSIDKHIGAVGRFEALLTTINGRLSKG